MNFLAHAYLSFNLPHILAGNMISDFVKGKKQYDYGSGVQAGIRLHRAIDSFTDIHPAIREMKKPFKQKYGLYAGPLVDVVCDYFLANDRNQFKSIGQLSLFSHETYRLLENQEELFPEKFKQYFFYMKEQDWLSNYQHQWMIQRSFTGLVRRAKYMHDADDAFYIFQNSIDALRPLYNDFFPALKMYAIKTFEDLPGSQANIV